MQISKSGEKILVPPLCQILVTPLLCSIYFNNGDDDLLLVQKSTASHTWLDCCCSTQHKLYSLLLPPTMGARFYRFLGRPAKWTRWLAGAAAIKAGDVETNPGPKHTRTQVWICDICHSEITRKQTSFR